MEHIKTLFDSLTTRLTSLVRGNAMMGKPISVGERHMLPLCELSVGFGGGGGQGEGQSEGGTPHRGFGAGAGGGARVSPVALLLVDGDQVRVEILG